MLSNLILSNYPKASQSQTVPEKCREQVGKVPRKERIPWCAFQECLFPLPYSTLHRQTDVFKFMYWTHLPPRDPWNTEATCKNVRRALLDKSSGPSSLASCTRRGPPSASGKPFSRGQGWHTPTPPPGVYQTPLFCSVASLDM